MLFRSFIPQQLQSYVTAVSGKRCNCYNICFALRVVVNLKQLSKSQSLPFQISLPGFTNATSSALLLNSIVSGTTACDIRVYVGEGERSETAMKTNDLPSVTFQLKQYRMYCRVNFTIEKGPVIYAKGNDHKNPNILTPNH